MAQVGSSPRLRGTPLTWCCAAVVMGIIPALAGNTTVIAQGRLAQRGSSPRLRGTLEYGGVIVIVHGIIPALAGNTVASTDSIGVVWDHPRACGEHVRLVPSPAVFLGSSPRLRGTPRMCVAKSSGRGIIPALAGNTERAHHRSRVLWDHPRACGEHPFLSVSVAHDTGSSPRLRGTRDGSAGRYSHRGIIPALAGNTCRLCRFCGGTRDHPRACGEHLPTCHTPSPIVGSSPRLRGTPRPQAPSRTRSGIIPALAGNTSI